MIGAGAMGTLRLAAAAMQRRTVLIDAYRTAPFHPAPVAYREGRAVVVLQDVSPGTLPGDVLEADVTVATGARLTVEAQGAARIYPSPHGVPATLTTELSVAPGGSLWWLPGPLIPYRDARYASRTDVRLEPGATFALLDILTPGRTAMGECHAYALLDLRTRIDMAGKPLLIERAFLEPAARRAMLGAGHEAFRCSGALFLVGYDLPSDIDPGDSAVWLGSDGGPDLAVVRAVSRSAETLRTALLSVLDRLGHNRLDGPPASSAARQWP